MIELAAGSEQAWRTTPVVTPLLAFIVEKYAPLARAWHREPGDVMYDAFKALRAPGTARARDPWAIVTRAVELGLAGEVHGERLMTSPDKARRPSMRPEFAPIRSGEYEEFFYGVLVVGDAESAREREERTGSGLVQAASRFLVMTGWSPRLVEPAVTYVIDRLSSLSSPESALDVLRKDAAIQLRLGLSSRAWSGLLRVLLGNPRARDRARYGVLARVALGADVQELQLDAALAATSRRAAERSRR
ncbi:hypothetical protein [Microbacterium rhizophilus]|uniref:hypothetical protein n=1 Tax=Microbacterium rhizophilus TaxID=3138934 RepID=UPI0031F14B64